MGRIVPENWMPDCRAKRIVVHWTAGGPTPSALDAEHYHFIVDRKGKLTRGEHSVADNDNTADDDYAAHTRGCNTSSIGVALCGMVGAVESPFNPGPYPLTKAQWNNALLAIADLCRRYGIKPEPTTLLMHCEVEGRLGIRQNGKWDIRVLPFDSGKWSSLTPGDEMRARVALLLK